MTRKITPRNRTAAELHYRATGNPPSTLPSSAISNCFPGLEYDFKNFWRRAFVGIVLLEWDNYVLEAEDPQHNGLVNRRLLRVDGRDIVTTTSGPRIPGGDAVPLQSVSSPDVITMEWSNNLAFVMQRQGDHVKCHFSLEQGEVSKPVPADPGQMLEVTLTVRQMFDGESAAPADGLLRPGELTQGLCSPWQHDYRECSCYYWPASRPDYVNIEPTPDGVSRGDNWLAKDPRPGEYILDDRKDSRLVSYDDLFMRWESMLKFQIRGRDAEKG